MQERRYTMYNITKQMYCVLQTPLSSRAETMRACALKVSKTERWKTTTHAVESLIEEKILNVFDSKMLILQQFMHGNYRQYGSHPV